MSADRNLLFGMLALHNGFVTREQLLDAMNAWMLQKQTPLEKIFLQRGVLRCEDLGLLEALVDRQVRRHGDARKSLASLHIDPEARRDLEQFPDEDVQASLASLPSFSTRRPESLGPETPPTSPLAPPLPRAAVGLRYRRLHAHARGGLGEVYVAFDEELRRRVALKEIQLRFADSPESRTRFVREAEITGNLEHPGVVPVYGLLLDADGRPVYAMRFIKGETLHDAIGRFHAADKKPGRDPGERRLALRHLLNRFVAVCNTVGYAHSKGVVHRDLKPANVMLGEYGETLVVDWGLARVLQPGDSGEATLQRLVASDDGETATQLGQVLGTPGFMPPEQARGEHEKVGAASDVFALGATLYALLTGAAPYSGSEALARARQCAFLPPRQVNASAPPALEAVCLKAMAEEPSRRYGSARELAEEVEHWLADEPLRAYREPLAARLRRWGRRHRTAVASGVVLLAAAVVGLGLGLWAVGREQTRTARALEEAEAHFALARRAVDECFGLARDDPVLQGDGMRRVRRRLLEKTLPFYEAFAQSRPDDPALAERQAEYLFRAAFITHEIGRRADALKGFEQVREIRQRLCEEHPGVARYQADLARVWGNLGNLQGQMGQLQEAFRSLEQARDVLERLCDTYPNEPAYQADLGRSLRGLGMLLGETGRTADALKVLDRARDIQARLSKANPQVAEYQSLLGGVWNALGVLHGQAGRVEEALRCFGQARDIYQGLARAHPEVTFYQYHLAHAWNNVGFLQFRTGQLKESLGSLEKARDIRVRLSLAHPEVHEHQADLAQTWGNLGVTQQGLGSLDEALKSLGQARDIQARLVRENPEVIPYHLDVGRTCGDLGIVQARLGKVQEAVHSLQQSHDVFQNLSRKHPEVTEFQSHLAKSWGNLGYCLDQAGKPQEALRCYEQARDAYHRLCDAHPESPQFQADFAHALGNLSDLQRRLGKVDESLRSTDQAARLLTAALRREPNHPHFARLLRHARVYRAGTLVASGDYRGAMKETDELARDAALSPESVANLACVAATAASAASRDAARPLAEREKQAEVWARQAVALLRRAAAAGYFEAPDTRALLDRIPDLDFLRGRDDYAAFVRSLPPAPAGSPR